MLLGAGALVLGSGLAANAGVLGRVLGAIGASGARDAVLAAWASAARVWVHLAAIVIGFGVIVVAAMPLPGARTRPGVYLSSALADPLRDFFSRYGSAGGLILALICLYRIPDFVLNIMNPFYLDLGYTLVEIAEVRKIFGVVMTMFGVFAGGVAVARYGLMRAMVIGALAGPLSNLLFIWLALQEHNLFALFAAIGLDNVAGGFAGTCLIAYMSSLTSAGFTATQYALFSSLYAIPGRLIASQSGRIVEAAARLADAGGVLAGMKDVVASQAPQNFAAALQRSGVTPGALGTGYIVFFAYSAVLGVFAVVLSLVVERRQERERREAMETPTRARGLAGSRHLPAAAIKVRAWPRPAPCREREQARPRLLGLRLVVDARIRRAPAVRGAGVDLDLRRQLRLGERLLQHVLLVGRALVVVRGDGDRNCALVFAACRCGLFGVSVHEPAAVERGDGADAVGHAPRRCGTRSGRPCSSPACRPCGSWRPTAC